jgi:hypothetical protein
MSCERRHSQSVSSFPHPAFSIPSSRSNTLLTLDMEWAIRMKRPIPKLVNTTLTSSTYVCIPATVRPLQGVRPCPSWSIQIIVRSERAGCHVSDRMTGIQNDVAEPSPWRKTRGSSVASFDVPERRETCIDRSVGVDTGMEIDSKSIPEDGIEREYTPRYSQSVSTRCTERSPSASRVFSINRHIWNIETSCHIVITSHGACISEV